MEPLSPRRKRRLGSRGSQIAEAAVVLPITFLLLFAIYWFGRAFSIYATINHAAREGAQTAAVPACANCTAACTWPGSALPCDAQVVSVMNNALSAARLDPTLAVASSPNPAPQICPGAVPPGACTPASGGGFTICRNVLLNQASSAPSVCGVIISFQYPYKATLPFTTLNNQTILLNAQVEMRGEN
jgi:hypothetical protein